LKAKGFEKAWYSNVFIQCSDCGGVNPNTSEGTGGWYEIGRDTVTIFNRPGSFIIELMVYELGHRFWFKQMGSAQRAKFEALVKTHTKPSVEVRLFKDRDIGNLKKRIEEAERSITATWNRARKYDLASLTSAARDEISKDGWSFGTDVIDTLTSLDVDKDLGSEVDRLKDDVYKTKAQLVEHFEDFSLATPETKADWLTKANELISKLVSEAFAEVFAHYVLEYEVTRDQAESFRAVLKTASLAQTVARRFMSLRSRTDAAARRTNGKRIHR